MVGPHGGIASDAAPLRARFALCFRSCPMTARPSACASSTSLSAVDAAQWDACALAPGAAGNPFLSHAFLKALEDSKSVGRRTGWQPQYLLAETDDGTLQGAVPLYVKGHSQGEYIFDHGWAQAFERAGGRYYPKLQAAVPFTPVPGPRLFARPGPYADARARRDDRHAGQDRRRQQHQLGACHLLHRGRLEALRRARLAAAAGPPVSLGQRRLQDASTISWARSPRASARRSARSARRCSARGWSSASSSGADLKPAALGRLLRLLHGHRRAQVGLALPHPLLLRHPGRDAWPTRSCW